MIRSGITNFKYCDSVATAVLYQSQPLTQEILSKKLTNMNAAVPSPSQHKTAEPAIEAVPIAIGRCPTAAAITRTVRSADLFGEAKTVLISHAGEQYRLIKTKNGRLLLQK